MVGGIAACARGALRRAAGFMKEETTFLWFIKLKSLAHYMSVQHHYTQFVKGIISTQDDHAPRSSCDGENQTVGYVNAIMQNPTLWRTTAIFWRGLDRVDTIWAFGPHPFGVLLVCMALLRRKRVVLGVRFG